jgi:aminobenzoyl-glutamate transport protein
MAQENSGPAAGNSGFLDWIEWIGNKLPDPITLFLIGTVTVMLLSHLAYLQQWQVIPQLPRQVMEMVEDETGQLKEVPVLDPVTGQPVLEWRTMTRTMREYLSEPVLDEEGEVITDPETGLPLTRVVTDPATGQPMSRLVDTGEPEILRARSLLTRDGLFWAISSMVVNFREFPPLGIVLVGILGIGLAERTGLIGACLKALMLVTPQGLLTPAMVFIGIMSSMALDAGYVVLPPLAAALYKAVGRSPLAGLAAVFAGVSAGFSANLFITSLDPLLASFSEPGAWVIDPEYRVNPACNWWFMIVSTVVITLTGWLVTAQFVEKRLSQRPPEEGGPSIPTETELAQQQLAPVEKTGLKITGVIFLALMALLLGQILHPSGALHGQGERFARWVEAIVPMLLILFLAPGIAYGIVVKTIRNDKDAARLLINTMASMGPIIVLAFFAAQFIEHFRYSGLDRMLAMAGGQLNPSLLVIAFILVTLVFNLFIGSMSAKYAMFAPIFVPIFMMVGISPELTQAAYRIGDSTSNIITPLNPYVVIILVFMQKLVPKGGMGTLISTMLPYTIVFTLVWTVLLVIWIGLGIPLGPDGNLFYLPP